MQLAWTMYADDYDDYIVASRWWVGGGLDYSDHPDQLEDATQTWARRLADGPSMGLAVTKRMLNAEASMTLGEYPDGVPETWRIAPEVFEAATRFPPSSSTRSCRWRPGGSISTRASIRSGSGAHFGSLSRS